MTLVHIALIAEDGLIVPFLELTAVATALQKQVIRDFSPIWEVQATVTAFEKLEEVPVGTWPIIITEKYLRGLQGAHEDSSGKPIGVVCYDRNWSLMASHVCLEMLADPDGNRTIPGQSIKPGQGIVEYLIEPCDPCKGPMFAYSIDDIIVSDFYTPQFFDPVKKARVRYSFTGSIKGVREVLESGFLSWYDPVSHLWFQQTNYTKKKTFVNLGDLQIGQKSYRSQINLITNSYGDMYPMDEVKVLLARTKKQKIEEGGISQAQAWRERVVELIHGAIDVWRF